MNRDLGQSMNRRRFLASLGSGLSGIALASLLDDEGALASESLQGSFRTHAPKAKRVIYLHMAGSPSQLELFDFKPTLQKYNGQPCPPSLLEGKRFAFIRGVPNMLGTPFSFQRQGQSGTWVSELLPEFSKVIDRVTMIKSMTTDQFNHAPAQLLFHTGSPQFGGAAMGSWVSYGLGSANRDLPTFVVLVTGGKKPSAGKSLWGSGFLPPHYQGIQCRTTGDPVLYASNPKGLGREARRDSLDVLNELNARQAEALGDPEIDARIAQYELAFRMQSAVPEAMDISREDPSVLDFYGAKPHHVSVADSADDPRAVTQGDDAAFANCCLLARRLVERGVRFVQIYDWGWDHHGVAPGEDIPANMPLKARQIDRPMTALILDLERRGLLDDTLIVWGGEFGRTPMQQNAGARYMGRDHHPDAFTMWMAGGGMKPGITYGKTDDLGYSIVEDKVTVRDVQAMILDQLGLHPKKLHYLHMGLENRLIGPEGHARIHPRLLA